MTLPTTKISFWLSWIALYKGEVYTCSIHSSIGSYMDLRIKSRYHIEYQLFILYYNIDTASAGGSSFTC